MYGLNVLADAKGISPAEVDKLLSDPKAANAALGGGKATAAFVKTYREFITLPSANAAFRQLFVELGEKNQLPALYHCTTGKDRTGWASAALADAARRPGRQSVRRLFAKQRIHPSRLQEFH